MKTQGFQLKIPWVELRGGSDREVLDNGNYGTIKPPLTL